MNRDSQSAQPVGSQSNHWIILAFANFVVGMGAFVVVGILTPVGNAFGVDRATAGWLLTAYALVYAVASPLLVSSTGALVRKHVLAAGLGLFALGALAAATAPSYVLLLIGRALMAMGGGLVTPVAAMIIMSLSPPHARGRALAAVFAGLTLAQVVGVPVGAWLGYNFGWRYSFALVATLSALAALAVLVRLPREIVTPVSRIAMLMEALTSPVQSIAIAFTAFFLGGIYAVYTYFAPFLETAQGLSGAGVTAMLVVFGLGAVLGNWMGGRLTDGVGSQRSLFLVSVAQIILMPLLTEISWLNLPAGLLLLAAIIGAWSAFGYAFMVPQQTRLAALDPARAPVLLALNAAAIYVGGSVGAAVGGASLRNFGIDSIGVAGAALCAFALISLRVTSALQREERQAERV